VPDDGCVVTGSTPLPHQNTPGERAQFVGGRLHWIDAGKRRDFWRLALGQGDQRLERAGHGWQGWRMKRHLDSDMRPEARPDAEEARVRQIDGEEPAGVADDQYASREPCCGEGLQYPGTVSAALLTGSRVACSLRHRHLEIDILGEPLDEPPALRQRRAPGKGWCHITMIHRRDDGQRAHDIPILFDQPFVGRQGTCHTLHQASVKHAQSSGRSRYSRSGAAPAW